jgi:hypothetical protein
MPLGKNIPPSFWKYLLILWRDVNHHKDNSANRTMRQFHMRGEDASRWTAALQVSGLFAVTYGWKHKLKETGIPTHFNYLDGDFETWEIFITALAQQLAADKDEHYNDSGGGFRGGLLLRIIKLQREKYGRLPQQWQKNYLTQLEKLGFVTVRKDGKELHFEVTGRLRSSRAGVLSAREQIEGAYPSKDAPEFDYDTGKQLRMYRQRERAVSRIRMDFSTRLVPATEQ